MRVFLYSMIPNYIPPNATAILNEWLPLIYNQMKEEIRIRYLSRAEYVNVFFDELDDYSGRRILNIFFSCDAKGLIWFWTNCYTEATEYTAVNLAGIVVTVCDELVNRPGKINSFVTDTCAAARRSTHELVTGRFPGAFVVLCDLYSL